MRDTDYVFRRGKVGFKGARAKDLKRCHALEKADFERGVERDVGNFAWDVGYARGIDFSRRGGQRKAEGTSASSLVGINFKG